MKFNIYVKQGIDEKEKISKVIDLLDGELSETPEYIYTFGGDGTFLDAVEKYGFGPIYVPINMGTLGFYSSWNSDDCQTLKKDIIDNNILNLNMIQINFKQGDKKISKHAINEMTIVNPVNTQILDIEINGTLFEKFRGSGICISTPTGSTAYNKSLGGAIISGRKNLFQLVKMAPINNIKYRTISNPIIFDDEEEISLVSDSGNFKHSILTIDRSTYNMVGVSEVKIKISDQKVKLLVPEDSNFYKRVHDAFIN